MREVSDNDVVEYAVSRGLTPATLFPRKSVQDVYCPECHAIPGHPCKSRRGPRKANHLARCFHRVKLYLGDRHG